MGCVGNKKEEQDVGTGFDFVHNVVEYILLSFFSKDDSKPINRSLAEETIASYTSLGNSPTRDSSLVSYILAWQAENRVGTTYDVNCF